MDILLELHKSHPGEDELIMQYLDVGICKAASVVDLVSIQVKVTSSCST